MDKYHHHRADCPFKFAPLDVCDCVEKNMQARIAELEAALQATCQREAAGIVRAEAKMDAAVNEALVEAAAHARNKWRDWKEAEPGDCEVECDVTACANIADGIMTLRPDATTAIDRVRREARVEALREALEAAYQADSLELAMHGEGKIADRIRALIEKEGNP